MNAERLLVLYDRVADAPDAVSRLRRFVLDLAVRGMLVPQDLSADCASWKTVKLGDACEVLDRLRRPITKANRVSGDYPYYGATGIVDWVVDYIFDEKLVLVGEDGAKWRSGDRTAFIAEGKYWVNNHAHVLRPIEGMVTHEWLAYYLTSIDLLPWVTGLTVPKLNQTRLRSIPIPLPLLADQRRIVAKVDELMVLCDRLEEARAAREQTRDRMTKASLARMSAPDTDDRAFSLHAGFAVDIFPALTARADQVKQLRRTVLDLAVRGKLVPQDLSADGASWKTVKLGDVAKISSGNSAPQDKQLFEGGLFPFIRTSDVGKIKTGIIHDARDRLNKKGIDKLRLFPRGTILFPKSGASTLTNHRVLLGVDAYVSSHLATIKADDIWLYDSYLFYFLQTVDAADLIPDSVYPSLKIATISSIDFRLPPVVDQHRIVAKVDELMVLCDQLEVGLDIAAKGRDRLLDSVFQNLPGPAVSELVG